MFGSCITPVILRVLTELGFQIYLVVLRVHTPCTDVCPLLNPRASGMLANS